MFRSSYTTFDIPSGLTGRVASGRVETELSGERWSPGTAKRRANIPQTRTSRGTQGPGRFPARACCRRTGSPPYLLHAREGPFAFRSDGWSTYVASSARTTPVRSRLVSTSVAVAVWWKCDRVLRQGIGRAKPVTHARENKIETSGPATGSRTRLIPNMPRCSVALCGGIVYR
jgi:hypothetical protein